MNADRLPDGFAVRHGAAEAMHAVGHEDLRRIGIQFQAIHDERIRSYPVFVVCGSWFSELFGFDPLRCEGDFSDPIDRIFQGLPLDLGICA